MASAECQTVKVSMNMAVTGWESDSMPSAKLPKRSYPLPTPGKECQTIQSFSIH